MGRRRHHDVNDTAPQLAEKLRLNDLLLRFQSLYNIFVNVLIKTNVSLSNELNLPYVYRSVNTWVASKVYLNPELHLIASKVYMNPETFTSQRK